MPKAISLNCLIISLNGYYAKCWHKILNKNPHVSFHLQGTYSWEKETEKSNNHTNKLKTATTMGTLKGDIYREMKILIGNSI